ncbi:MAG TPA: helix-turn-helix domain-containing protein [Candidatus Limnocylindrales bacterium]|nr:helix-turn-helix domain-containing protein [Candidatus Limnocylindrales bacterium]
MDDLRFGAAMRAARLQRSLRQVDVARLSRVSDVSVSRMERGALDELSLGSIRRVAGALGVHVRLLPRAPGGQLDRLINVRHAALAEHVVMLLRRGGWEVRPEVSFGIYGERGVVDLLAWHAASRALLVIELKTAIVDVGEILGTLDRKRRLAPRIAADLSWRPAVIGTWLAIGESMTSRRRVAAHRATFAAALPDDGIRIRRWLARPVGAVNALSFVTDRREKGLRSRFATLQRAPGRRAAATHARVAGPPREPGPVPRPNGPGSLVKPPPDGGL